MNDFSSLGINILIVSAVFLIIASVINILHVRRTMKRMDNMLDQAIAGDFNADTINESMLSALEFKFARYLGDMELSVKNSAYEKEKIKTLISDISHQTKTPISNIVLYSELLQEQDLDETSANYAKALNAQAGKLNFLIISLIKMSRLETGILSLHPKSEPLLPLLEKAYIQLAPKAASKGLNFDIVFPDKKKQNTDIRAFFDEKWTLEALCNIIDNAIKYTDTGSVTIEASIYEIFCHIKIIDTGIGIPEEEQAQIFSRFYRSPQAADKEGIGIGLYLAREIIANEGGYIKLISKPGQGSSFSVFLPLEIKY